MQGNINLWENSKTKSLGYSYEELRCLHTNAQSMGNQQEELEVRIKERDYDLIGITETWWDNSHNWNNRIVGYDI